MRAGQSGHEFGRAGADGITLGVAHESRAGDLVGGALQCEAAGGIHQGQSIGNSVNQQAAAERPARSRLRHDLLQHLADLGTGLRVARFELRPDGIGQSRQEGLVQIERTTVGDAGCQSMLRTRGTWSEVASQAPPDECHPRRVHIATSGDEVDDGGDDVLPVGAHRQALLDQRSALAGAVEHQRVVAARQCGRAVEGVQLLGRSVVPACDDHSGTRPGVALDSEEVARQGRALIGDLHDLGRLCQQVRPLAEQLRLPLIRLLQSVIDRRLQEHQARGAMVGGSAPTGLPGRFRVARRECRLGSLSGGLSGGTPFAEPRVRVGVGDPGGRGHDFTQDGRIGCQTRGPHGLRVQQWVGVEDPARGRGRGHIGSGRHGGHCPIPEHSAHPSPSTRHIYRPRPLGKFISEPSEHPLPQGPRHIYCRALGTSIARRPPSRGGPIIGRAPHRP